MMLLTELCFVQYGKEIFSGILKTLPVVKFNFHNDCNFADFSDCSTEGPIVSSGLILFSDTFLHAIYEGWKD